MYEDFSSDYDRFVNWPGRLAVELPFIEHQLLMGGAHRVLDAACGTGMHTIALAQRGYVAVGADLSAGMIERARANAITAGIPVQFEVSGFGELSAQFGTGFDALLCLGNSLPHLLTSKDLAVTLADFAACLRPDGLLLIQNRNFDAVLAHRQRWMELQTHREGDAEWLFLRFYDFEPDGTLTFNLMTLRREGVNKWSQHVAATRLWPLRQEELTTALVQTGFGDIVRYGDLSGAPFDSESSGNLVVTARQTKGKEKETR
ncbi:MAG: methyltransferase domain-containing protein [Chloroflexota bacterium]|nr:methyltransferase domain-containing protein [Chloroflexota bacterium]